MSGTAASTNSGWAGEVGAAGSHEMSVGREILVPITAPQLTHDVVAEGVSAALSHHQAATKRATPPQELPPNKQPCLASSARPLQAVRHESFLCNPSLESTSTILGVRDPRSTKPRERGSALWYSASQFTCRHPGCKKAFSSSDAVRKHCRKEHSDWLRSLPNLGPTTYCMPKQAPARAEAGKDRF